MPRIKYSTRPPREKRKHYLRPEDIEVLLDRLPVEVWDRLHTVYFDDRSRGARILGYVNMGHRDIALCALPPRVSLTRFLVWRPTNRYTAHRSPHAFGAMRGRTWPELAVRRYQLYNTFLHELGHLQIVAPTATNVRRRFASECRAQEFADFWRNTLWSEHFDHPDPVHNRPTAAEISMTAN
jgi:hypothetical protein